MFGHRAPVGKVKPPRRFRLWVEVVLAYVTPALMAGLSGLVAGRSDLVTAAVTTIAGTSALVAILVGTWLQLSAGRPRWLVTGGRVRVVAGLSAAAAGVAALVAWLATSVLAGQLTAQWSLHLWTDLPIAAALATAIVTWHWRGSAAVPQ